MLSLSYTAQPCLTRQGHSDKCLSSQENNSFAKTHILLVFESNRALALWQPLGQTHGVSSTGLLQLASTSRDKGALAVAK